jgi:hypothetical protein
MTPASLNTGGVPDIFAGVRIDDSGSVYRRLRGSDGGGLALILTQRFVTYEKRAGAGECTEHKEGKKH